MVRDVPSLRLCATSRLEAADATAPLPSALLSGAWHGRLSLPEPTHPVTEWRDMCIAVLSDNKLGGGGVLVKRDGSAPFTLAGHCDLGRGTVTLCLRSPDGGPDRSTYTCWMFVALNQTGQVGAFLRGKAPFHGLFLERQGAEHARPACPRIPACIDRAHFRIR